MSANERERPRIKVTDKRRFAADAGTEAGSPREPASADAGSEPSGPEPAPDTEVGDAEPSGAGDGIDEVRAEAREYLEHLKRLQAEFDNYRKRVLKEQTLAVERASEPVMRRLLEVVDDFELALTAAAAKPDFDRFLHGVELVFAKFLDTLRTEGLERIEAQGKPFDPEQHEALLQTGDGEGDLAVADVLRPGYTLRGRVLRPAGVRVERA